MKKQYIKNKTDVIDWVYYNINIKGYNREFRTKDNINFYMRTGFTDKIYKPVNNKSTLEIIKNHIKGGKIK